MIYQGNYKNRPAIIVENKTLRAVILPQDGAKMASLVAVQKNKELLATKSGNEYKVLDYEGSYVDSECSAFDDMCPTIDPYTPDGGENAGKTYPDHGECCRLAHDVQMTADSAIFTARSRLFPITYKKTVTAKEDGLAVTYEIENEGKEEFPFLWAGHVMLKGEDGMTLRTPFEENAPMEMVFVTLGYDQAALPKDRLMGFAPGNGAAYKFYYLEKIKEGRFSAVYANGEELTFSYDKDKLPYLGVWLNNGEFQNLYNIAPEPCNIPFDSPEKAKLKGYTASIPAKEKFKMTIDISYKGEKNEQSNYESDNRLRAARRTYGNG